jgi:hypothetical protein
VYSTRLHAALSICRECWLSTRTDGDAAQSCSVTSAGDTALLPSETLPLVLTLPATGNRVTAEKPDSQADRAPELSPHVVTGYRVQAALGRSRTEKGLKFGADTQESKV